MSSLSNYPQREYQIGSTWNERPRWIFLDIKNPVVAWAACRGVLAPAHRLNYADATFPSLFFISRMTNAILTDKGKIIFGNEMSLESVRKSSFPNAVSRLSCLFTFSSIREAQKAILNWGTVNNHFNEDCLVECDLEECIESTHDSNWIFKGRNDPNFPEWKEKYWAGEPCPEYEPIWETLSQGRALIQTNELRQRAFELTIQNNFPKSLPLMEISRIAATLGYDLGAITPWISGNIITFIINAVGLDNAEFLLSMIKEYEQAYGPFNSHFFKENGGLFVPDLLPMSLEIY